MIKFNKLKISNTGTENFNIIRTISYADLVPGATSGIQPTVYAYKWFDFLINNNLWENGLFITRIAYSASSTMIGYLYSLNNNYYGSAILNDIDGNLYTARYFNGLKSVYKYDGSLQSAPA